MSIDKIVVAFLFICFSIGVAYLTKKASQEINKEIIELNATDNNKE